MTEWVDNARALAREGRRAMLVVVAGVRGSAPREPGARMIVTAGETIGTIGGGQLEYRCTQIACDVLRQPRGGPAFLRRFPLGADCGQCCGGVVDVLFEPLEAAAAWLETIGRLCDGGEASALVTRLDKGSVTHAVVTATGDAGPDAPFFCDDALRRLACETLARRCTATVRSAEATVLIEPVASPDFVIAVFGAGHVGAATVAVLGTLDARIRWVDSRRGILPERVPRNVQVVATDAPASEVGAMPPGAYYLVMTHSHPLDLDICSRVLQRGDFAYLGLIGSRSKRRNFERRLAAAGLTGLERLTCPIGVAGVSGKAPAEIAIAAAAEILKIRSERRGAETPAVDRLSPVKGRGA